MFTNQLPSCEKLFKVEYSKFAERHFLKRFKKDYPGKQWQLTEESIKQDLSRIGISDLQKTQQIDEMWYSNSFWLAKYDFRIAGHNNQSSKSSGNRAILSLDAKKTCIKILIIYGKTDLPKNMTETEWIKSTISREFPEIMKVNLSDEE